MSTKELATKKDPAENKDSEVVKLKGKYIATIGRRKTAIARVRVYKNGTGVFLVNDQKINDYLTPSYAPIAAQALKSSGLSKDLDVTVMTSGGGKKAQAEAIRHGVARALVEIDVAHKPGLKAQGLLTRDSRSKERKKPGLRRARRAPQWAKR